MKATKSLKKILCGAAVLVFSWTVLAGCGDDGDNDPEGISIYVGSAIFDESLDPVKGAMPDGYPFTNNALIKVGTDSQYVGDLADSWTVSDDALTYTFTLKEGVRFHDGSDFTAEDVVFTYNRVKENQGSNENVDLSRMASAEALGDYTVAFTLTEPYSSFLDQTASLGIVPGDGYDEEAFNTQPVGTGPWKVVQYDPQQKIIVRANEAYYDGAPSIPQVTILNMEPDTAIANARSGQLDLVMVEPGYTDEEVEGMRAVNLETMDVRQISLPVTEEARYTTEKGETVTAGNNVTSDEAVREALDTGIDRQQIIDDALNGVGTPAEGFTENLQWGNPAKFEDGRKDEARALLEAADWTEGEDGIYVKDGERCAFTLISPSGDTGRYQLAEAFAAEAKLLGIEIKVEQMTWAEINTAAASNAVVWGWGQYDPIILKNLFYSEAFTGDSTKNTVRYSDSRTDSLIDGAVNAGSREEAVEYWKQVQASAAEDHAYIYIVNIQHTYFVSDRLDISEETQIPHAHGHGVPVINNMKDWTLV